MTCVSLASNAGKSDVKERAALRGRLNSSSKQRPSRPRVSNLQDKRSGLYSSSWCHPMFMYHLIQARHNCFHLRRERHSRGGGGGGTSCRSDSLQHVAMASRCLALAQLI